MEMQEGFKERVGGEEKKDKTMNKRREGDVTVRQQSLSPSGALI